MKRFAVLILLGLLSLSFLIGQEVQLRKEQPFWYAYLEGQGSYNGVGGLIGQLLTEAQKQGVQMMGGPMAVYYNFPGQVPVAELKWAVLLPIYAEQQVQEPLKKAQFNFPTVVTTVHHGPYATAQTTYNLMLFFIKQKGYKIIGPFLKTTWTTPRR